MKQSKFVKKTNIQTILKGLAEILASIVKTSTVEREYLKPYWKSERTTTVSNLNKKALFYFIFTLFIFDLKLLIYTHTHTHTNLCIASTVIT